MTERTVDRFLMMDFVTPMDSTCSCSWCGAEFAGGAATLRCGPRVYCDRECAKGGPVDLCAPPVTELRPGAEENTAAMADHAARAPGNASPALRLNPGADSGGSPVGTFETNLLSKPFAEILAEMNARSESTHLKRDMAWAILRSKLQDQGDPDAWAAFLVIEGEREDTK